MIVYKIGNQQKYFWSIESNTQERQGAFKDRTHLAALLAGVVSAAAAGRDRILVLDLVKGLEVI